MYPVPKNLILETVPENLLAGRITLLRFDEGHIFFRAHEPLQQVVFPLRGVVSISLSDGEGHDIEVLMIGNEGIVGAPLFFGTKTAPWMASARTSGEAFVMSAAAFSECLNQSPAFGSALLRNTHQSTYLLARLAVCRGAHTIDKQCARWLLMMRDRIQRNTFPLTQEFFARTLGVRKASISVALSTLQKMGIIQYERGHLTIVDPDRLEQASCNCYELIKMEAERLRREQAE
jgi:CRP-like cAMP-binding protein